MEKDHSSFDSLQRITFAISSIPAFLNEPATLVKPILTFCTDDTNADILFRSLFKTPPNKMSSVALPLVARIYSEASKIPRLFSRSCNDV